MLSVAHQGQLPAVTLSFNLAHGMSLGDAVRETENAQRDIGMPRSVQGSFAGTAQAFQASLASEPVLIVAALITVHIVFGMLYESFVHPITILSTLPSAGVVKKNAIMMIDFALDAERRGEELARRDLRGVPAALPPDHVDDDGDDGDDGGDARRRAAGCARHRPLPLALGAR